VDSSLFRTHQNAEHVFNCAGDPGLDMSLELRDINDQVGIQGSPGNMTTLVDEPGSKRNLDGLFGELT